MELKLNRTHIQHAVPLVQVLGERYWVGGGGGLRVQGSSINWVHR